MKFDVSSASFDTMLDRIEQILANMDVQTQGMSRTGMLLSGDPGTGKTSFVRLFSELVGLNLITIEAPHITEEHIVNIPFIVFDPVTKKSKNMSTTASGTDYKIVLADSNLHTQIARADKIPDNIYLKSIYSGPANLIKLFETLGGNKTTIPDSIAEVRNHFSTLLFLDEYFRQTSMRIRNMLRGILNGKIGANDIPPHAYVMYASNLAGSSAEGVEDIPQNTDMLTVKFQAPEKDDWFAWLVSKFESDEKVKLNEKVIDKFHELLTDEHLNNHDVAADVRTSPRRWEQLLLYINASVPVKDEKEAKALLSNVKVNFRHYLTGEHSELAAKVLHAVASLIKETSDIEVSGADTHDNDEWRTVLEHQIVTKKKLGKHRKYIPIISGPPGIGKTSEVAQIAADQDLRYIYIDCSTLDPEDLQGMPLAKTKEDGGMETRFSEPKLYRQIKEDIDKQDALYVQQLKEKGEDKKAKSYDNTEWKYLIFFDEMNRTSTKVFNGIRRVLLEKNFGDDLPLPEGSIVIAAINPTDLGTTELTGHMQDVVDVIDSHASWKSTKAYLDKIQFKKLKNQSSKGIIETAVMRFADRFKTKSSEVKGTQRQFYIDVGASTIYISPREYTTLYTNAVTFFDSKANRIVGGVNLSKLTNDELMEIESKLKTAIFTSFESTLETILTKHNTSSPEFMADLKHWMLHGEDIDLGDGVFYHKAKTASFATIAQPYFDDPSLDLTDELEFAAFMGNSDPQKFKEEMTDFLISTVKKEDDVIKNLITKEHSKKVLGDDGKSIEVAEKEFVSKLEHFIRGVVHSIDVHNMSNDKREMVLGSVTDFLKQIQGLNTNNLTELLQFNRAIYSFMKGKIK